MELFTARHEKLNEAVEFRFLTTMSKFVVCLFEIWFEVVQSSCQLPQKGTCNVLAVLGFLILVIKVHIRNANVLAFITFFKMVDNLATVIRSSNLKLYVRNDLPTPAGRTTFSYAEGRNGGNVPEPRQ